MDVLYINDFPQIGGAEGIMLAHIRTLQAEFEVAALLPGEGALANALRSQGIHVYTTPMPEVALRRPLRMLRDTKRYRGALTQLLSRLSPRVLVFNSIRAGIAGGAVPRASGVPAIWYVQDHFTGLRRQVVKASAEANADAIVTISKTCQAMFRPGKAQLIYNGIDPARFYFRAAARRAQRQLLGLKSDEIGVGLIGNIAPWKGHSHFLDVAERVLTSDIRFRFFIVGQPMMGGDEAFLRAVLRRVKETPILRGRVVRLSWTAQVDELLSGLDIVMVPSRLEPFGLIVTEAMATERIVLATKFGGPGEVISHGVDGFLINPNSPDESARTLCEIAKARDQWHQIGQEARRTVSSRYSSTRCTAQFAEVVRKYAREPAEGGCTA